MTTTRSSALLRLQQNLVAPRGGQAQAPAPLLELLPFEAASFRWSIPCVEVARVMMPAEVISLAGYPQIPTCVVGVVAADSEMLSVVDAALLLGHEPCNQSLKSRLIVFGDGPLKGFALLVDRVHERIGADDASAHELRRLDSVTLQSRLQQKKPIPREFQ